MTGAPQVDLVGHSLGGGMLPRYYLKFIPGAAAKVHTLVGLSPTNHGTTLSTMAMLADVVPILGPGIFWMIGAVAPGLTEQVVNSPVNVMLDAGGDTVPGVDYYTIVTRYDEVSTPYGNQFLVGPRVKNQLLQENCTLDMNEHVSTLYSARAWHYALNALDPANATPVPCYYQAPFTPFFQKYMGK